MAFKTPTDGRMEIRPHHTGSRKSVMPTSKYRVLKLSDYFDLPKPGDARRRQEGNPELMKTTEQKREISRRRKQSRRARSKGAH